MDTETSWMHLIRHGATKYNLAKPVVLQGSGIDADLADEGREQAAAAAEALAKRPIRAVYASDLRRNQQTAEIIAGPHQLPVHTLPAVREISVGRWEGWNWDEVRARDPEAYRRFRETPQTHGYPEGENLTELRARIVPALQGLLEKHAGQQIVVVGHSVVNRQYVAYLLGLPPEGSVPLTQANGAINVIRRRQGEVKLISYNSVLHLRDW